MDIAELNTRLETYDEEFFSSLDLVLAKISEKSQALASNLKDCIVQLKDSDRYLRAYEGKPVAIKEAELEATEFDIFRKYVRLLRSCTIMCGQEVSGEFKPLFLDFFAGKRLDLAKALNNGTN